MNKYPTLEGYVLVAPLDHREQVTGDMSVAEYLALQEFVYLVAEAIRKIDTTTEIRIKPFRLICPPFNITWLFGIPPPTMNGSE